MSKADRNIDTHGPLLSALFLHIIAHDIFCVSAFMKVFAILKSSVKILHPEHSTEHSEQSKKMEEEDAERGRGRRSESRYLVSVFL